MVRKYKRTLGTRKYKDYVDDKLDEALKKIVEEGWSIRQASRDYGIPFGTLYNKYKGLHVNNIGHPKLFTAQEEAKLIQSAAICGDWGYTLSKMDLQHLAKNYLDSQGRVVKGLKDNKPGIDWVDGVLNRNKSEICRTLAANIKRARATVSEKTLQDYFNNLRITVENVPASNIFNYDETNFADDPGKTLKLYRRGIKYPEQICNSTKSATTVMMCGSATGVLLPPYIVFRSIKMWNTWTQGGPKGYPCCGERCCRNGSRYNRTDHGWMEGSTFTNWFLTCFLPHAKKLEGKKVLIGDNLAAHFTNDVLQSCEEHNISFPCLVPNSTHLTQPLDVCFFRPMKVAWRKILLDWKAKNPKLASLPKDEFPGLLQKALIVLDGNKIDGADLRTNATENAIKNNLISGFAATGIVPFDPARVLSKIPGYNENPDEELLNSSLISLLQEKRFGNSEKNKPRTKKSMLNVEPGKSVSVPHLDSGLSDIVDNISETQSESWINDEHESSTGSISNSKVDNDYNEGDFVLIKVTVENTEIYKFYVAEIIEIVTPETMNVRFMRCKKGNKQNIFVFPDVEDESIVHKNEIVKKVKLLSARRGRYLFKNVGEQFANFVYY